MASFQLIKLPIDRHLLVFTAQMIICDGWGFKVVLEEIAALYSALVEGREPSLPAVTQMHEYPLWQAQEEGLAKAKESNEFWLSQYGTVPSALELPTSGVRAPIRSFKADRVSLRLEAEFYQEIKRAARELRNTPFALLLAAYETWLHRLSGSTDFVIGVPFAGQAALELNAIVGQCVHTLPFRVKADGSMPFADLLTNTRNQILDAQEYWNSNLGVIVQRLPIPNEPSRPPLASVMFNLDPPMNELGFSGCKSILMKFWPKILFPFRSWLQYHRRGQRSLLLECDFNAGLFDAGTIRCLDGELPAQFSSKECLHESQATAQPVAGSERIRATETHCR